MYLPTHYAFAIVFIILLESSALFIYTLIGLIKANPLPFLIPPQQLPICQYANPAITGSPDLDLGGNSVHGIQQIAPAIRTIAVTSVATSTTVLISYMTATATMTSVQTQVSSELQTSVQTEEQTQTQTQTQTLQQTQTASPIPSASASKSQAPGFPHLLAPPHTATETNTVTVTVSLTAEPTASPTQRKLINTPQNRSEANASQADALKAGAESSTASKSEEGAVTVTSMRILSTTLASKGAATRSVVLVTSFVDPEAVAKATAKAG